MSAQRPDAMGMVGRRLKKFAERNGFRWIAFSYDPRSGRALEQFPCRAEKGVHDCVTHLLGNGNREDWKEGVGIIQWDGKSWQDAACWTWEAGKLRDRFGINVLDAKLIESLKPIAAEVMAWQAAQRGSGGVWRVAVHDSNRKLVEDYPCAAPETVFTHFRNSVAEALESGKQVTVSIFERFEATSDGHGNTKAAAQWHWEHPTMINVQRELLDPQILDGLQRTMEGIDPITGGLLEEIEGEDGKPTLVKTWQPPAQGFVTLFEELDKKEVRLQAQGGRLGQDELADSLIRRARKPKELS